MDSRRPSAWGAVGGGGSMPTAAELGLSEEEYRAMVEEQRQADERARVRDADRAAAEALDESLPTATVVFDPWAPPLLQGPQPPHTPGQRRSSRRSSRQSVGESQPQALAVPVPVPTLALSLRQPQTEAGAGQSHIVSLGPPLASQPYAVAPGFGLYEGARGGISARGNGRPKDELVDLDAAFAEQLQRQELAMAAAAAAAVDRGSSQGNTLTSPSGGRTITVQAIEDPLWGVFHPPGPPGSTFPPQTLLCAMCCPCAMPPCTAEKRRRACGNACATWSVFLALVQTSLWVLSMTFRGAAPLGINPLVGPWPDTLDLMQAKNSAKLIYGAASMAEVAAGKHVWPSLSAGRGPEVWRLVTPIFLHAGLVHLGMNLLMQLRLGLYMEVTWGSTVYALIYFGSGLCSSLASAVLKPESLSVGSSGALMGVLGAWILHMLGTWGRGSAELQHHRAQQLMIAVLNAAVIFSLSFSPMIDWAAHAGGFLGGLLLGAWFFLRPGVSTGATPLGSSSASASAAQGGGLSTPRGVGPSDPFSTGLFSRSGAGLLLEPPVRGPLLSQCCPCLPEGPTPEPTQPRKRAVLAWAGLLLYFLALFILALLLWLPGQPIVKPPGHLLDLCTSLRVSYPQYSLRCPW